jgi:hypothetical protein
MWLSSLNIGKISTKKTEKKHLQQIRYKFSKLLGTYSATQCIILIKKKNTSLSPLSLSLWILGYTGALSFLLNYGFDFFISKFTNKREGQRSNQSSPGARRSI